MAPLPELEPERIGVDPARLDRACRLLERWARADRVPAAGFGVVRGGGWFEPRLSGRMGLEPDAPPVRPDALFLVASITKPVTVTAALILAERGELALDDRVADYVPAFAQNGKRDVRVRHL